jgi:hypothetical protein
MDAHTRKAPRLSDPQRGALTLVHQGSVFYRADRFGHGYFSARGASEITLNARTIDSLIGHGLIVEDLDRFRELRGGLVRVRPYRLTDAGRTALGLVEQAPRGDVPATVDVANIRVGMATPLGWVDYVSPLDDGGAIIYYRPFDRSALTCRVWPAGERLTLVPCPHISSFIDRSRCAKCGHELGSVAA